MTAGLGTAEHSLSEAEFRRIALLLRQRAGIALPDTKRPLVFSRLVRRLRALGLDSFAAYIALVEGAQGDSEVVEMISALTTNVTSFFREKHHFEYLRGTILPPLVDQVRKGARLRLWSAGCSSGEEPYTLAMVLLAVFPDAARHDVRILATDIDPDILQRARTGTYPEASVETIPAPILGRHFRREGELWSAGPELRELITFRELNLAAPWPVRGPFDVIFCRNVAIYFDREGQERVWSGFADRLRPGGWLCIGHSERLTGEASRRLTSVGITAYQLG
jgi:chemotaxis protein methyltransferase CheR